MTRRASVLALLLVAGLLALVASAQSWWRAVGDRGPAGLRGTVTFTGADATGGLSQALAIVVLVGVLLALVLAIRGRRVLAVLLALAGLGVAAVGALRQHTERRSGPYAVPAAQPRRAVRTRGHRLVLGLRPRRRRGGRRARFCCSSLRPVGRSDAQRFERRAPTRRAAYGWPRRPGAGLGRPRRRAGPDQHRDERADDSDERRTTRHPETTTPMCGPAPQPDTMVDEEKSGAGRNLDPGTGSGGVSAPASRRRNEEQ